MPTGNPPLRPDTILTACEDVLRRHGPEKASVVEIARALGVSHTAIYRHFPTKQELREAVSRRWLDRTRDELASIAFDQHVPPAERLRAWLHAVLEGKQEKLREDPELFRAFGILAAEHSRVAEEHVADLIAHLEAIIADGIASHAFQGEDPALLARSTFAATARFHHLALADTWSEPGLGAQLDAVCDLILSGLSIRATVPGSAA